MAIFINPCLLTRQTQKLITMEENIIPIVSGVIVLLLIFKSLLVVKEQSAFIIERFGKFIKIAHPGLNVIIPFIDKKAASVNLRVQQLDVTIETKTLDDVFVNLQVSVQYSVRKGMVKEAYYSLENPKIKLLPIFLMM